MRAPTFLLNLMLASVLFTATSAQAANDLSYTQSYTPYQQDTYQKPADNDVYDRLQEMLFEQSLDKYLSYDVETVNAGIKVHSSMGVKLRSDATYFQFKMTF